MNKRVLKQVCQFLRNQKNNEAHFATFWDKTKDFYPEDQSKTKVKQWLREHSEQFEIIAEKNGNPFGKIRLKVTKEVGGKEETQSESSTMPEEDDVIVGKLLDKIDETEDDQLLFCNVCNQKSEIFPALLQDKKLIRKWLNEHRNYFEITMDLNGGIHAVRATQQARKKRRRVAVLPKRNPKVQKDTGSVDRVHEASSTVDKISLFIEINGGSVAFDTLVLQEGTFPGLRGSDSIRSFLFNFPDRFKFGFSAVDGEVVCLTKPTGKVKKDSNLTIPLQNLHHTQEGGSIQPLERVVNFLCENGGIVAFDNLLKQAREMISSHINSDNALVSWLLSNEKHFDVLPNPSGSTSHGQVKLKLNILPRFCLAYVTEKKCSKENCAFLHICKAYFCNHHHSNDDCMQSHNIRDDHNKVIVDKSKVLQKQDNQSVVKILLKSCFPRVCFDFNKNKGGQCPRKEKCPFLHVCGDYVWNQCPGCPLSHNLVDGLHNIQLLKKYSLLPSKKLTIEMVKANIAYVQIAKQSREEEAASKVSCSSSEKGAQRKRSRHKRSAKMAPSSLDKASSKLTDSICGASESESDDCSSSEKSASSKTLPSLLSLNPTNLSRSKLDSSLSGDQKVQSWMNNFGLGFAAKQGLQPRRERLASTSSSERSVQSSVISSHESFQLTGSEKRVFTTLLEKYDGSAPFQVLSKDTSLFPPTADFDVRKWLENRPNTFVLRLNGRGQVERVNAFSRKCRICLDYSRERGCSNKNCRYFHICRNLVEGQCRQGAACHLNHDFASDQIKQLAKQFNLQDLATDQLRQLVRLSTPNVCSYYNKPSGCNRGVHCPNIHVCKKFVKGKCLQKSGCKFGHIDALQTSHSNRLLNQYQMARQKPNYVCKMLFVFSEKQAVAEKAVSSKADSSSMEKTVADLPESYSSVGSLKEATAAEKVDLKICSLFLTGQAHDKSCNVMHHRMPYLWQYKLGGGPSGKWCKFNEDDCEDIEKLFCDVRCTVVERNMATKIIKKSSTPHSTVRLDFLSMSGSIQPSSDDKPIEFSLRRLESNARNTTGEGYWYQAQWMWYKLDGPIWIKHEPSRISALEESYLEGTIQIDPSSLRRRPAVFVTRSEVQEKRERLSTNTVVPRQPKPVTIHSVSEPMSNMHVNSGSAYSTPLPPTSNKCHRVKVESGTQDYHMIERLLRDSTGSLELKINQLDKIRNDTLWNKYSSKKKQMTDCLLPGESVNERYLFVPCRHDDVKRVMKDNVHVSRIDVPVSFGPGHHFTTDAALCLGLCTQSSTQSRFLLVCQVLVGTYTQGSRNTAVFPRRHDSRFYDSLVNDITEPTVFVVPDVDQCYPAFIIDFSCATFPGYPQPQESPISPTISSYPSPPLTSNQNPGVSALSQPMYHSFVTGQRVPSMQATSPTSSYPHIPQSSTVPSRDPATHMEECAKAPPPYSERPGYNSHTIHSDAPPSYSAYPQPGTGYPQPAGGHPQPARSYSQPAGGLAQPAPGYPLGHPPPSINHPPPPRSYSQPTSGYPPPASVYSQPASTGDLQPASGHPHPTVTGRFPGQGSEGRGRPDRNNKDKECVVM